MQLAKGSAKNRLKGSPRMCRVDQTRHFLPESSPNPHIAFCYQFEQFGRSETIRQFCIIIWEMLKNLNVWSILVHTTLLHSKNLFLWALKRHSTYHNFLFLPDYVFMIYPVSEGLACLFAVHFIPQVRDLRGTDFSVLLPHLPAPPEIYVILSRLHPQHSCFVLIPMAKAHINVAYWFYSMHPWI